MTIKTTLYSSPSILFDINFINFVINISSTFILNLFSNAISSKYLFISYYNHTIAHININIPHPAQMNISNRRYILSGISSPAYIITTYSKGRRRLSLNARKLKINKANIVKIDTVYAEKAYLITLNLAGQNYLGSKMFDALFDLY